MGGVWGLTIDMWFTLAWLSTGWNILMVMGIFDRYFNDAEEIDLCCEVSDSLPLADEL